MTSYELLEAYNIDLSVDPAIESLMDNAEIADRVYTSVLEQMDPAIESEYESIRRAAMEAEAATTSWFDRIRNAVSKFVAAVGNVLSSITRKLKLFFTKSNAKKAEKEAAELEEKIRKDQIKTIAKNVGDAAYTVGKAAVPKVLFGLIQDRPHGIYQTIMSVVSNATNQTSLQKVSNAADVALKASQTKEKADKFKRGVYRFFKKATHPFSKQYDETDTPNKQGKRASADAIEVSIKDLQKSAQIAGSEASELEKAMRSSTNMIQKAMSNRTIDGNAMNNMRRDVTDVYNEAIDIIRKRTNAIREAVSKISKGYTDSEGTKWSSKKAYQAEYERTKKSFAGINEPDDEDTKTY